MALVSCPKRQAKQQSLRNLWNGESTQIRPCYCKRSRTSISDYTIYYIYITSLISQKLSLSFIWSLASCNSKRRAWKILVAFSASVTGQRSSRQLENHSRNHWTLFSQSFKPCMLDLIIPNLCNKQLYQLHLISISDGPVFSTVTYGSCRQAQRPLGKIWCRSN